MSYHPGCLLRVQNPLLDENSHNSAVVEIVERSSSIRWEITLTNVSSHLEIEAKCLIANTHIQNYISTGLVHIISRSIGGRTIKCIDFACDTHGRRTYIG